MLGTNILSGLSSLSLWAFILSLIGAGIAIFCYMPGAIKTIKYNDTRGISAIMFGLTVFGCLIWIIYSILSLCDAATQTDAAIRGRSFVGGCATLISNLGLGSFGSVILVKKIINLVKAKKEGLTEDQWYKKHYENKTKNKK